MAKDGLPIRRTPVQSRWDSRRFRDRYLEGADLTAHRSFAAGCGALSSVSHLCPRISKSKGDNDANTQSVLVPAGSAQWAMLLRLYFDFQISTPWYCSDANGDISYYIVVYLDGAGHLGAYVDGWSYNYNGGGPFCTGGINDALSSAVPAGIGSLQNLLSSGLGLLGGTSFSSVYLLPGDGTKAPGDTSENADVDAAIAVLP